MTCRAKSWIAIEARRVYHTCMANRCSLHTATAWTLQARKASWRTTTTCLRRIGRRACSKTTSPRFTCFRIRTTAPMELFNSNRQFKTTWCCKDLIVSSSCSTKEGSLVLVVLLMLTSWLEELVLVECQCLVLVAVREDTSSSVTRVRMLVLWARATSRSRTKFNRGSEQPCSLAQVGRDHSTAMLEKLVSSFSTMARRSSSISSSSSQAAITAFHQEAEAVSKITRIVEIRNFDCLSTYYNEWIPHCYLNKSVH